MNTNFMPAKSCGMGCHEFRNAVCNIADVLFSHGEAGKVLLLGTTIGRSCICTFMVRKDINEHLSTAYCW